MVSWEFSLLLKGLNHPLKQNGIVSKRPLFPNMFIASPEITYLALFLEGYFLVFRRSVTNNLRNIKAILRRDLVKYIEGNIFKKRTLSYENQQKQKMPFNWRGAGGGHMDHHGASVGISNPRGVGASI